MEQTSQSAEALPIETWVSRFHSVVGYSARSSALKLLIYLNVVILLSRPQDMLPILGASKLPLIMSLVAIPITLAGVNKLLESLQLKAMILFLALGGAMVPLAHNNFWAYHTFRDLLMQFIAYFFPAYLLFTSGRDIRKLVDVLIGVGCFLSLYGLTHVGKGPGGFLGDENDLGLAIIALMGFPLLSLENSKGARRWLYLGSTAIMLAGIVATASRGAFIGVALLGLCAVLQSTQKLKIAAIGVFLILAGLPFVPAEYWTDVQSIGDLEESTSSERLDTWKIAVSIWIHPPYFISGAGMNNAPMLFGDFEPRENQTHTGKSLAGRAAHSSLFQLLPDLGLLGALLFGSIVFVCFFGNRRKIKDCLALSAKLASTSSNLTQHSRRVLRFADYEKEAEVLAPLKVVRKIEGREDVTIGQCLRLIRSVEDEVRKLRVLLIGSLASLMGVLGTGLFISALYYPSFWLVATVIAILQNYSNRIFITANGIIDSFEFPKNEEEA